MALGILGFLCLGATSFEITDNLQREGCNSSDLPGVWHDSHGGTGSVTGQSRVENQPRVSRRRYWDCVGSAGGGLKSDEERLSSPLVYPSREHTS